DYIITNKLTPFISMQNHDNLGARDDAHTEGTHFGVGSIPWSSLAGSALSRPLSQ
ncbi:hypothetical protein B0H13DRAFT_1632864, partial [Mycena leptocephala]